MNDWILLGIILWMTWVHWFPDADRLLQMVPRNASPPVDSWELWAMHLYRVTFVPDCRIRRIRTGMLWASAVCLIAFLMLSVCTTLCATGLLPSNASLVAWILFLVIIVDQFVLLVLLIMEIVLLYRKKIPFSPRVRMGRWLERHPASEQRPRQNNQKQPWWFWLDSNLSDTLIQMCIFMGGFVISILGALFGLHLAAPAYFTAGRFWNLVFCWSMVFLWLPVSLTVWLSSIDWKYRDREVLLSWACKQARMHQSF